MSTKKKRVPNPRGRPKGSKNKATEAIKYAYTLLLERNSAKLDEWLERVAEDNPAKAMEIIIKMTPYVIPRLAQAEVKLDTSRSEIDYSKLTEEELEKLYKELDSEE